MNRDKIFCLFLSIIFSAILFSLTLKFTFLLGTFSFGIFVIYLALSYLIIESFYEMIRGKLLKQNLYGSLTGLSGIGFIFSFTVGCFGNISGKFVIMTFYIAFVAFCIFCSLWSGSKNK